jgi:hypothetical protein
MVDRFQELAEQSGLAFVAPSSLEPHVLQFAQLIVKDVVNIMENSNGDLDFAIWETNNLFLRND